MAEEQACSKGGCGGCGCVKKVVAAIVLVLLGAILGYLCGSNCGKGACSKDKMMNCPMTSMATPPAK